MGTADEWLRGLPPAALVLVRKGQAMSIRWTGSLPKNLRNLDPYILRRMGAAAHAFAPRAEAHMKNTAPWTDRTGNARNSLTARPEIRANEAAVILAHGVPYGIWLEVTNGGVNAVVIPSVMQLGPQYMALVARFIFINGSIGSD